MQREILSEQTDTQVHQTTAIIIANPTSGSYFQHEREFKETVEVLRTHGWDVSLCLTQAAGDARRLAREAVEHNVNVVIAAGGDGTINEIIQELANSETALGVLPNGTVNVWARETGIPFDHHGAREVLLHGPTRRIDLGLTQERYFLLMAGIGFDGEVTHAVERKSAKRFGVLGYLVVGTWLGLGYPSFRAFLQLDGRVIKTRALQIIIGNTRLYGGAIKYTWNAKCDDGLLDVCILRPRNIWGRIIVGFDFLLGRKERHQWVRYETCKTLKLRLPRTVAMQLDGDPAGHISKGYPPTTITIAPQALKVIVPEQPAENIFS